MTRVQILLDTKEVRALRRQAHESGKSYSLLVREAIDAMYVSRLSENEISLMAKEAKQGKGIKKFKDSKADAQIAWNRLNEFGLISAKTLA